MLYRVTYEGWFGATISRTFDTLARATQWATQCGVLNRATIIKE